MAQQFVGIDLGSSSVRCVVTTAGFRGIQVHESYEVEVSAEDAGDRLGRCMRSLDAALELLRREGIDHLPAGIAISGNLASTRALRFPFSDAKRIAQVLPFELDESLARPLASYAFDHAAAATASGGVAVAVAVERELVDGVVERCRAEGLDVRLVTTVPAALAQTQVGGVEPIAAEGDEEEEARVATALVVDLGARSTEIAAVTNDGVVALRSTRRGGKHLTAAFARAYGQTEPEAERSKRDSAFLPHEGLPPMTPDQRRVAELVEGTLEVVFREIEHTQLWLRNELQHEMSEIRLAGAGAEIGGIEPYLQARFGVPVRTVSPQIRALGHAPTGGWALHCAALGASFGAARRPLVRLDDASAMERDAGWMQGQLNTVVLVGIVALILACVDTLVKVQSLEKQRDLLSEEIGSVTRRYFGEEFSSRQEIEDAVKSVGGTDLTKAIPQRGALEVLEMIARAASPSDAAENAAGGTANGVAAVPEVAGLTPQGPVDATGALIAKDPAGEGTSPEDAAGTTVTIDNDAGIVLSDALELASIDLRERKMDLKLSATRASAQDRLAIKLESLGCVQAITKGRIVDRNERKVFEMIVDHNCYRQADLEKVEAP